MIRVRLRTLPGHSHLLRHVLEAHAVARLPHAVGVVLLQLAHQEHAEPDGLSVDEVLPRQVLEGIEEDMLRSFDGARVPAGVRKRGATPANRLGQRANALVRDVMDLIERSENRIEDTPRLGCPPCVEPPLLFDLADALCELPIPVGGVVAEDIAHARAVQRCGRSLDHVEVDVHRLGNDPTDVADDPVAADRAAMAERGVHRQRRRHLEQRQPSPARRRTSPRRSPARRRDRRQPRPPAAPRREPRARAPPTSRRSGRWRPDRTSSRTSARDRAWSRRGTDARGSSAARRAGSARRWC